MFSSVDDAALYGIYGVIGLGALGVVLWIVSSLIGARSRSSGPESGGWRPPGRR